MLPKRKASVSVKEMVGAGDWGTQDLVFSAVGLPFIVSAKI